MKAAVLFSILFLAVTSFAKDLAKTYELKKGLIVGVLDFSKGYSYSNVAKQGDLLLIKDSHFKSMIVSEIHENTFGIHFIDEENDQIKGTAAFVAFVKETIKGAGPNYEGHHIGNDAVILK